MLGSQFKTLYTDPRGQSYARMRDINKLSSLDYSGMTVAQARPFKSEEVAFGVGDTQDYGALRTAMKQGPQAGNVPPVAVQPNPDDPWTTYELRNGGHRHAIAHELGWKMMPVTGDLDKSGYGDMTHAGLNPAAQHMQDAINAMQFGS